ncbi:hypothetical protein ScPMuIL_010444 [Solemya velum]
MVHRKDKTFRFDIWTLVQRPSSANPYALTAKYRGTKTPPRRVRSGTVARRRKRPGSRADGTPDTNSTEPVDVLDVSKDFAEEFDYDADDAESERQSDQSTHTQQIYLKACRLYKVTPTSYFYKNLNSDHIALQHHVLGPEGTKAIAIALVTNSSVQSLDLSDNNIGPKGVEYVADLLRENSFITDLTLANNDIRVEGARTIINVVKELDTLTKLNLSGNRFRECDAEIFKELIEETRHLKVLNLSHNEFRERGGEIIGEALANNDTLEVLDLSWNHLRRGGADAIAEGLEANTSLKRVNLSWNGFHMDGAKSLACTLEYNTTLQELDLTCNRINKECLNHLLKGLKKNSTLRTLKLGWNPITSVGAMTLLAAINETKTIGLTELDLGDQIVEKPFEVLLEEMEKQRKIQVTYGISYGQGGASKNDDDEALVNESPVVVLMEFGKLMGFRLIDLFSAMDKDGSKSLDKDEIKQGLRYANIPLGEKALDKLIEKLDIDGDGEIDFGELMMGQQEHRKKLSKMYLASANDEDVEETEVGRVRVKLQRLMAKKMKGNPEFKSKVEQFQCSLQSGFTDISNQQPSNEKMKLEVTFQDPNWKELHV